MPNDEFEYYAYVFSIITHTNLQNMQKGPSWEIPTRVL